MFVLTKGIIGGSFLERKRLAKPNGSPSDPTTYYHPEVRDVLFVRKILRFLSHQKAFPALGIFLVALSFPGICCKPRCLFLSFCLLLPISHIFPVSFSLLYLTQYLALLLTIHLFPCVCACVCVSVFVPMSVSVSVCVRICMWVVKLCSTSSTSSSWMLTSMPFITWSATATSSRTLTCHSSCPSSEGPPLPTWTKSNMLFPRLTAEIQERWLTVHSSKFSHDVTTHT